MDLKEIKKQVINILPEKAQVTKVEALGPDIFVYSKNISCFYEDDKYISDIAKLLKKRVNVRAEISTLMDVGLAKAEILKIVPQDAKVSAIYFDNYFSEVVIECFKPGLVIGKGGSTTKEIISKTNWTPNIIRSPINDSKIITTIRSHIFKNGKDRREIYSNASKKIYSDRKSSKDWIRICALGAFREIGRSCILVQTANSKVLLDCGANVAASGEDKYPMLDTLGFPLNELDAVIISHAHTDHVGFLPYLFRMGYSGPVYCTPPTRDLMYVMQMDYINVSQKDGEDTIYSESDVRHMLKHVITRDYNEVTDVTNDIRITFHNASHILGSASVHLHIGDGAHNLMYSADIKYGHTKLFDHMDTKYPRVETLIIEGTYCGKDDILPERYLAEERLINSINETVAKGGNILIPVFAVGRSQEVMLVLEEYFRRNKLNAKNVYIDGLIKDVCSIHTTYPEYLKSSVQRRILQNDSPFSSPLFKEVTHRGQREEIVQEGSNVILATSGMLVGGPSLEYFYKMATDPNNKLLFVGYQGDGSLGRKIMAGVKEIPIPDDKGKLRSMPLNLEVENIQGFSGHSDRKQLEAYISSINPKPKRILIDHSEKEKGIAFAKHIATKFQLSASSPSVLECIRLR